jgi:EEF1A N-terminal glycine/lysine methyltransferase
MEEVVVGIPSAAPLFGGPLPFGIYRHKGVGDIKVKTRSNRKFDGLFADDIWPGALLIADYLSEHPFLCQNKYILEVGAGASLPSLVASKLSPKHLVITDYPDDDIIDNIRQCVEDNQVDIAYSVVGYIWGDDSSQLLNLLPSSHLFDLIILSEVLWKDTYPQHR